MRRTEGTDDANTADEILLQPEEERALGGRLPGGDASTEQRAGLKAAEQRLHLRLEHSSLVKMQSLIQPAMGPSSLHLQLACRNANADS